jgi:organic hydroperoxide reductase OsmC/OhrA
MKFTALISWKKRADEVFTDNKYHRSHDWVFDGGSMVLASSSPHVVPLPFSDASAVDPEEAMVASVSSCHMLFFLSIAAAKKYKIESYIDQAEGEMGKNTHGKTVITNVTLRPKIVFSGENLPTAEKINHLHELAHHECFIANSVNFEIKIETE